MTKKGVKRYERDQRNYIRYIGWLYVNAGSRPII